MSGSKVFLDTNIVLYLMSGDSNLADLLDSKTVYISFITELELLGFQELGNDELKKIEIFLSSVSIIEFNSEIKK